MKIRDLLLSNIPSQRDGLCGFKIIDASGLCVEMRHPGRDTALAVERIAGTQRETDTHAFRRSFVDSRDEFDGIPALPPIDQQSLFSLDRSEKVTDLGRMAFQLQ